MATFFTYKVRDDITGTTSGLLPTFETLPNCFDFSPHHEHTFFAILMP